MDHLRDEYGNQIIENIEGFDAVKTLIRNEIQGQLGLNNTERIFLLSNCVKNVERDGQRHLIYDNSPDYEFDALVKKIQDDMLGEGGVAAEKARTLILATDAICESAIRAKADILRNESWNWSTLSGIIGAVPIPGVSYICDAAIIVSRAKDYFDAFGLDSTRYLGQGTPLEKLKHLIGTEWFVSATARTILVGRMAIGLNLFEEGIKIVPVIGSVVGAGISFVSTSVLLRLLIDFCEIEAIKMIQS